MPGVTWQRCRVHWLRNALSHVPQSCQAMAATALRQLFVQANRWEAHATMDFPQNHWSKIYSTNPLERQNKEVKRRSAVVGIFPCEASTVRLIEAVLMEQNDEWLLQDRYMPKESLARTIVRVKQAVIGCFRSYFFLFVAVNSGDRLGLLFRRDSR